MPFSFYLKYVPAGINARLMREYRPAAAIWSCDARTQFGRGMMLSLTIAPANIVPVVMARPKLA